MNYLKLRSLGKLDWEPARDNPEIQSILALFFLFPFESPLFGFFMIEIVYEKFEDNRYVDES